MERDWARLGQTMAAARRRAGLSQVDVADAIGVSRTPIQAIERGHTSGRPFARVTGTMRSYARLLGWAEGSIEAVLDGGEPKVEQKESKVEQTLKDTLLSLAPDLPMDIRHELSAETGPVIGTTVLTVPGASPGSRMIVVMKGEPDASPEQIRADLLAWADKQRQLRDDPASPSSGMQET